MGLLELLCFDSEHNDNISEVSQQILHSRVIDMAVIMSESCSECQNQQGLGGIIRSFLFGIPCSFSDETNLHDSSNLILNI